MSPIERGRHGLAVFEFDNEQPLIERFDPNDLPTFHRNQAFVVWGIPQSPQLLKTDPIGNSLNTFDMEITEEYALLQIIHAAPTTFARTGNSEVTVTINNQLPPIAQVQNSATLTAPGTFTPHLPVHVGQVQVSLNGTDLSFQTLDQFIYYIVILDSRETEPPTTISYELIAGPGGRRANNN